MAARLIKPLYVRYDVRTVKTLASHPRNASSNGGGAARDLSEQKAGAEPPAKTGDDRSIKVVRDDSVIVRARADSTFAPPVTRLGESSIKVTRGEKATAPARATTAPPPPAKNLGDSSIKVTRDSQPEAEPQLDLQPTSTAKSADASPVDPIRDERVIADPYTDDSPAPEPAKSSDDVSIKVHRDENAGAEPGPDVPPTKHSDDRVAKFLRHDKIVIEELEREPRFPLPKPRKRRVERNDDYISDRTIIVITGAVIATAFAFTLMLPSLLTRDPVVSAPVVASRSPVQRAAPKQIETTPSVPAPLPTPPPAPARAAVAPAGPAPAVAPAPAQGPASVVATVPALRGSAPAQAQVDRGATQQVLVRDAKTAGRTTLTAAEMAAVNRGLQELEKAAPAKAPTRVVAPTRTAATRPALTDEEKAAIERGLKALEQEKAQPPAP